MLTYCQLDLWQHEICSVKHFVFQKNAVENILYEHYVQSCSHVAVQGLYATFPYVRAIFQLSVIIF